MFQISPFLHGGYSIAKLNNIVKVSKVNKGFKIEQLA